MAVRSGRHPPFLMAPDICIAEPPNTMMGSCMNDQGIQSRARQGAQHEIRSPELTMISKTNRSRDVFHPLCLNPSSHWRRLRKLHPRVDAAFADRARSIAWVSPLMTAMGAIERMVYGRAIRREPLVHDPVFVIGHWRSGTTLLHSIFSKDPQFGYVTLFQTLAPGAFLAGRRSLQPLLALRAPDTRPMDNVKIRMPYPSEEEFALAHLCPQSAYLGWYFPSDWPELFAKFALMRGMTSEETAEWRSAYRELLVKATINFSGRRLVLKNPMNTARIDALLEMFPNAKFIHIYRNPHDVFRATLHFFREVLKVTTLQEISDARIQEYVLDFYPRVMNAYWEQRDNIPAGNHVEVRYEDLVADPLVEVERIYGELQLGGWSDALGPVEKFLASRVSHHRNRYSSDLRQRELVEERWGFAFDRLGYDRRSTGEGAALSAGA